jgi:hypothetical protein
MGDRLTILLERLLTFWLLVWGLFGWLPLVRAFFDGASYQWGTTWFGTTISGAGVTTAIVLPAIKTIVALFAIYAVQRRVRPWNWVIPLGLTSLLVADGIHGYLTDPDAFWFHGDTLGVHINLGIAIPVFNAAFLIVAALHSVRQHRAAGGSIPLSTTNRRWLVTLALLLPVQFVLLRFGTPHGTTDQIGVVITILQWLLVGAALRRTEVRRPDRAAPIA